MSIPLNPPQGTCEIEQPTGWYCSRDFHHNGPCAAHKIPNTARPTPAPSVELLPPVAEKTGLKVNYYRVSIKNPHQAVEPYMAECSDIIEALGMTFNEGEAFKAIWRKAAQRTLGLKKEGGDAKYDAEKVAHFGARMLAEIVGKKDSRVAAVQAVQLLTANLETCVRQARNLYSGYDPRAEIDAISKKLSEHAKEL